MALGQVQTGFDLALDSALENELLQHNYDVWIHLLLFFAFTCYLALNVDFHGFLVECGKTLRGRGVFLCVCIFASLYVIVGRKMLLSLA